MTKKDARKPTGWTFQFEPLPQGTSCYFCLHSLDNQGSVFFLKGKEWLEETKHAHRDCYLKSLGKREK